MVNKTEVLRGSGPKEPGGGRAGPGKKGSGRGNKRERECVKLAVREKRQGRNDGHKRLLPLKKDIRSRSTNRSTSPGSRSGVEESSWNGKVKSRAIIVVTFYRP